jgi:hypothetical protein
MKRNAWLGARDFVAGKLHVEHQIQLVPPLRVLPEHDLACHRKWSDRHVSAALFLELTLKRLVCRFPKLDVTTWQVVVQSLIISAQEHLGSTPYQTTNDDLNRCCQVWISGSMFAGAVVHYGS